MQTVKKTLLPLALVLGLVLAAQAGEADFDHFKLATQKGSDSLTVKINGFGGTAIYNEYNPDAETQSPVINEALVPDNDDCANAEPIGDTIIVFNTTGATDDGPITQPACSPETRANIWYRYTSSITGPIEISFDDTTMESQVLDPRVAVYDGWVCPGRTAIPTLSSLAGGETIETAVEITGDLPLAVTGTTVGHSHDYELSCVFEWEIYRDNPDVVYSYTPDFTGTVNIILSGDYEQMFDPALAIMDINENELFCHDFKNLSPEFVFNFSVSEGETYYIIVSGGTLGSPIQEGTFTLTIESPDYTIIDFNADYGNIYPRITFDAIEGHEYLIEIGGRDNREEGDGIMTIGPAPPLSENDDCENATDGGVLTEESPLTLTGSTDRATSDCGRNKEPEVWIKFTTLDTMRIELNFCSSPEFRNSSIWSFYTHCPCSEDYLPANEGMLDVCADNQDESQWHVTFESIPPDTYYYPIDGIQKGEYQINIKGTKYHKCNENTMYGQNPSMSRDQTTFLGSEVQYGVAQFDDFRSVRDSIKQVSWWGSTAYSSIDGFVDCDVDELPFQIIFCRDGVMPGDTIAIYDVIASPQSTFQEYFGFFQKKFTAQIDPPLGLDRGWISIRGNNSIEDSCWFFWQDAEEGHSWQYIVGANQWNELESDVAFCIEDTATVVDIDDEPAELPLEYGLSQNYPNPFNATTTIQFSLRTAGEVTLTIFDILGRQIRSFDGGVLQAGMHSIIWNGTDESGEAVASGVYFYRLENSEDTISKRMLLLK